MKHFAITAFVLLIAFNGYGQQAEGISMDSLGAMLQGKWQFDSLPGETMNFECKQDGKDIYYIRFRTINVLWHHKERATRPAAPLNVFSGGEIIDIEGRVPAVVPKSADHYYLCQVLTDHNGIGRVKSRFQVKSVSRTKLVIYGGFDSLQNYYSLTKAE